MIRLTDVDESNWLEIARLSVSEAQRRFLAPPIGIIARGYVYRDCNARVIGNSNDAEMVGVALVRDFIDEPVGYDLQQFILDERFHNRGIGKPPRQGVGCRQIAHCQKRNNDGKNQ